MERPVADLRVDGVRAPRRAEEGPGRAAARNKPVLVVKSGRFEEGAKAAASHTGALAGADDVYFAAFRRCGMLRVFAIDELFDEWGFKAIFLGTGAGTPTFMGIPGENLSGVYSANEFLTRVNLMGAYKFPRNDTPIRVGKAVGVIGGGNTAMDAVRTSKRLGAEKAYLIYRRSREEMPAREEEIHHAEQEGVRFEFLTAPVEVLGDEKGWVSGLKCVRMELGEPDDSGRRRPVPIAGSEFEVACDVAVVALGTLSNPLLTNATPAIELNKWGNIVTDESHATSMAGVFAGGDIVRGGATVILAMGDGKAAARSIDAYLQGQGDRASGVAG